MVPLVSHSGYSRVLIVTFNRPKGRGVFLRGILVARWSQDSASVPNALAYCALHLACHAVVAGSRENLFGAEVAFSAAIRSRIDGDILVFKSATGSSNLCGPTFPPWDAFECPVRTRPMMACGLGTSCDSGGESAGHADCVWQARGLALARCSAKSRRPCRPALSDPLAGTLTALRGPGKKSPLQRPRSVS